jgi:transcription initiation factor TFIID subunit 5
MWDAMGGMCRVIFKGHEGPVECIDSTLQGFLVASGSSDGTVRLWDVNQETGCKALRKFVGHDAGVNAVRFCSTAVAVSASNDRTLRIWDRRVKGCVNVLTGHVGPVTCIEVSLASKSAIASGSADTTVQLWDMRSTSRGPMMNLGSHSDRVSCLYRLPRSIISVGEDASMTEWEWTPKTSSPPSSPGKQQPPRPMGLFREHACGISCVSGNSQVVVTGSWDGSARMWNLRR